ncbi:DUF4112 domain-containing protein [Geobacter sp. DSM 9736]|uniref:DUF4112 domain-containing protein n=1 Tax=Geobacter sp. DSM 9736 TaxID=1277350 RepID=UPI000B50A94A|nr:DUF4112 domain-containing protein [Geobacter sp. DSM 9736]SNB47124.1 protein of unknown function [Geobacter sp. DSM 9736]
MKPTEREKARKRLDRLAWLTDNSIPLPGLDARIGFEPVIGLIPWFGDALGAILSGYIISEAARLGAPKSVLLKMTFNVAVDTLVGALPGLGDLFDFVWKANQRNVRLLERYIERPRKTVVASRLFMAFIILLLVALVVLTALAGFWLVQALWRAVT